MEQWEQEMVRKLGLEDVEWDPHEHCDCCIAKREALAEEAREAREEEARKAREASQRVLDKLLMEQAREEMEQEAREAAEREARELDDDEAGLPDGDEAHTEYEPLSMRGEVLLRDPRMLH